MSRRLKRCVRAGLSSVLLVAALAVSGESKPGPKAISMRFVRTDIATVLTSLAGQVGFDVVIGSGVEGQIDLDLTEVNWETALEAIAATSGLACHWNGEVLVVLPSGEDGKGELVHRVLTLRYADPAAVKAALASVLSSRGKIEILGMPNPTASQGGKNAPVLILSELGYRMPGLIELVDSLDVPRPQFEIAARFIETDLDETQATGFNWPTRITGTLADRPEENTGSDQSTARLSYPAAEYPVPDGKIWRIGTLSIDQLTGYLEMLKQDGHSRLLSDPRVTVLENQTAQMKVTTTFPIQTLNRFTEGAVIQDIVDFQDLEVGITLSVTPRLNDSSRITLEVEPVVEEITGFTGPQNNQRPITAKRTVKTVVRVGDNQTIVIGGLVRETNFTTRSKVFLLGDIPILGTLFTHEKIEKKKTDLLIFITPRILASAGSS